MLSFFRRSSRRAAELERRRIYIESYSFPAALREKLEARPDLDLTGSQASRVLDGLRTWFVACLYADGKTLGMPSRAVDVAWHEFILMTREYQSFCDEAFGYYLHHSPEETMDEAMPDTLRRTLTTLEREPAVPGYVGIPFLFALDGELGIADGQAWTREDIDSLRSSQPAQADASGAFAGPFVGDNGSDGDGGGWFGGDGGGFSGGDGGGGGGCGGGA
jgi:uncharacterized membrane protein YgcG